MALETKLVQKLSQSLLLTPQLQQAIKLLQLGRLEYLEAIQKELLENPLLEEVKETEGPEAQAAKAAGSQDNEAPLPPASQDDNSGDQTPPAERSAMDWEDYLESYTDYRGSATPKGLVNNEDYVSPESNISRGENLVDYLVAQIRLADLPEKEEGITLQIIGNLDKNGYLCATFEEIGQTCSCTLTEVEKAAEFVRSLDPPGVGARDLRECLAIQLDSQGLSDGLEARIVLNHLDKIEKRRFDLIAKAEEVAIEQVYKAVNAIKKLEPCPGRAFSEETARYIVPDVYVYKVAGEYVISLNDDGLPKLRVSPYYLDLLRTQEGGDDQNRTYLNERLKAASWLIRSIMQRQQTIYRVAESIVKFQRAFLDHGIAHLRPLILKDVADDIKMHESTVSRVCNSKYIHTPQGVFELKFFFSSGIKTADGDVSSLSIKEKIKNIISAEPPSNPISDQGIVELLEKGNIKIARRTVAKYRESLGIESSSRRKKSF